MNQTTVNLLLLMSLVFIPLAINSFILNLNISSAKKLSNLITLPKILFSIQSAWPKVMMRDPRMYIYIYINLWAYVYTHYIYVLHIYIYIYIYASKRRFAVDQEFGYIGMVS